MARSDQRVRRTAAAVLTAVVATTLAGCGGDSAYCAAVKEHRSALNSFGEKRTTAGYTTYAKAVRAVAATAPDSIKPDWAELGKVTDGVLTAQEKVGVPLEDMDPTTAERLDADDLERLNKAYDAFNDTASQRKAVVADVKTACDVTLS